MKKVIHSENAPKAVGPYSQAIDANGMIFISGQVPINPESGEMITGSIADKTIRIMNSIKAILKEAGCDLSNIIKVSIFLKDLNNFAEVNETYASFFIDYFPARETVEVSKLPLDSDIEISCIAYKE